jgi:hypothetical protein
MGRRKARVLTNLVEESCRPAVFADFLGRVASVSHLGTRGYIGAFTGQRTRGAGKRVGSSVREVVWEAEICQ